MTGLEGRGGALDDLLPVVVVGRARVCLVSDGIHSSCPVKPSSIHSVSSRGRLGLVGAEASHFFEVNEEALDEETTIRNGLDASSDSGSDRDDGPFSDRRSLGLLVEDVALMLAVRDEFETTVETECDIGNGLSGRPSCFTS